jgi:protein involved in polysaccharide export with SLBB domain
MYEDRLLARFFMHEMYAFLPCIRLLRRCRTAASRLRVAGLIALVCLVSACNGVNPDLAASPAPATAELRLAAGDKLRVTIFGEDKLSGEYQVDNAGAPFRPRASPSPN